MGRPARRRPGFLATAVIPLLAGSAITAIAVGWLMHRAGDPRVPTSTGEAAAGIETAPLKRIDGGGLVVVRTEPAVRREETGAVPRNVTPAGVTPGPSVVGPLIRVERQIVDIGLPPAAPETLYRRVVILDAGSFRSVVDRKAVMVRIADIEPPSFDALCRDGKGNEWKCGARARAELARLIGSRAVSCTTTDDSQALAPLMRCRVGRTDLATWLIENGWADPAPGAPSELSGLADRARAGGKGRFGPAPLGVIAG